MQGYRKPKTFGKHKNLITVVLISLIMVGIAVYFTILKNNEQNTQKTEPAPDNQTMAIPKEPESQVKVTEPTTPEPTPSPEENDSQQTNAEPPEETPPAEISFAWPCDSMNIGQEYSGLTPVFSETLQDWRAHPAVDIVTEKPENVYAAADGTVEDVYTDGLMGNTVLIRHSETLYTVYQSLDENPKVLKNMEVKKGDLIGKTGQSASAEETVGCHLHFTVIENGTHCDPAARMENQTPTQTPTPAE